MKNQQLTGAQKCKLKLKCPAALQFHYELSLFGKTVEQGQLIYCSPFLTCLSVLPRKVPGLTAWF